jgi:hypothetical protein
MTASAHGTGGAANAAAVEAAPITTNPLLSVGSLCLKAEAHSFSLMHVVKVSFPSIRYAKSLFDLPNAALHRVDDVSALSKHQHSLFH